MESEKNIMPCNSLDCYVVIWNFTCLFSTTKNFYFNILSKVPCCLNIHVVNIDHLIPWRFQRSISWERSLVSCDIGETGASCPPRVSAHVTVDKLCWWCKYVTLLRTKLPWNYLDNTQRFIEVFVKNRFCLT